MPLSFKSLSDDYMGFTNHSAKISCGGKEIASLSNVRTLIVELTALYEASSCLFEIKGSFKQDENRMALDDTIVKALKVGNIVEVELGYDENLKKVFKGYIDSVEIVFAQETGRSIIVECLDAKGIMMNNYKSEIKKDIKKYSDAVSKIFKDYSSISSKQKVTDSKDITSTIEQHNESDYEFIVRMARKLNYSFYILCDEIIFEPVANDKTVLMNIEADNHVIEFSMKKTLEKMVSKVIARNSDEQNPTKCFEGEATTYKSLGENSNISASNVSKLLSKATRIVIDPSIDSDAAAKSLAEATLSRLSMNIGKGSIKFVGIPDIMPGKLLSITGLSDEYDASYYITKTIHYVCGEYFNTVCEIGVNKI